MSSARKRVAFTATLLHIGTMSDDTKPSAAPSVPGAAPRRTEAAVPPDPVAPGTKTLGPAATPIESKSPVPPANARPAEIGGPAGPEPTRFGDWERNGRCTDF